MSTSDIADAMQLSTLAGWNQTAEDWNRLLSLACAHCFCIEHEARVVATSTLLCYGTDIAWLGMVLTHPGHRGNGYARHLVKHCLDCAAQLGVRTIKLDATEAGRRVYQRLGFEDEQPIERWERSGPASLPSSPQRFCRALDGAAYGYDRSGVLATLGCEDGCSDAFLLTRPGWLRPYLGPFISTTVDAARALLSALPNDSGCFWDILPSNGSAVELAREFGFTPVRLLVRMRMGEERPERSNLIYGIAGFELG